MLDDVVIAMAALAVAACLGASARPRARLVLFISALLISAALFLPLTLLRASLPLPVMRALESLAHALHATVPELAHLLIFSWLAWALWTLRPDWRGWRTIAVLVVLAIGSELAQGLTVERHPRVSDVGIDLLAEAVGLVIAITLTALGRARQGTATSPSAATAPASPRSGRE